MSRIREYNKDDASMPSDHRLRRRPRVPDTRKGSKVTQETGSGRAQPSTGSKKMGARDGRIYRVRRADDSGEAACLKQPAMLVYTGSKSAAALTFSQPRRRPCGCPAVSGSHDNVQRRRRSGGAQTAALVRHPRELSANNQAQVASERAATAKTARRRGVTQHNHNTLLSYKTARGALPSLHPHV